MLMVELSVVSAIIAFIFWFIAFLGLILNEKKRIVETGALDLHLNLIIIFTQ